jgi:hypothetical protein
MRRGFHFRVEILTAHTNFGVILGEIFGHTLRQRRHEDALTLFCTDTNLVQQIVNLSTDRAELSTAGSVRPVGV